jgi:hypothetical protein
MMAPLELATDRLRALLAETEALTTRLEGRPDLLPLLQQLAETRRFLVWYDQDMPGEEPETWIRA